MATAHLDFAPGEMHHLVRNILSLPVEQVQAAGAVATGPGLICDGQERIICRLKRNGVL